VGHVQLASQLGCCTAQHTQGAARLYPATRRAHAHLHARAPARTLTRARARVAFLTPSRPQPRGAVWRGRQSPVLIDHAAGFRKDAFVTLDHENAFCTGGTTHLNDST
jgi:hypothetical protein